MAGKARFIRRNIRILGMVMARWLPNHLESSRKSKNLVRLAVGVAIVVGVLAPATAKAAVVGPIGIKSAPRVSIARIVDSRRADLPAAKRSPLARAAAPPFASWARTASRRLPGTAPVSAASAGSVSQAWPSWGNVGGAHSAPSDTLISSSNVPRFSQTWRVNPCDGAGTDGAAQPVVAGGVAYFSACGSVIAVDMGTAQEIWESQPITGATTPTYSNSAVFAPGGSGYVALNAADGDETWTTTLPQDSISSAAVSGSNIILSDGPSVYALSQSSGAIVWTYTAPSWLSEQGSYDISSPVVQDGTAYFVSQFDIFALSTLDGSLQWSAPINNGDGYNSWDGAGFSDPIVSGGMVYAWAMAGNAGAEMEGVLTAGPPVEPGPNPDPDVCYAVWCDNGSWASGDLALADGTIYGTFDNSLSAFDAQTGATVWTGPGDWGDEGPSVANGVLFGSGGAYDATDGAQLWTAPIGCATAITISGPNMLCSSGNVSLFDYSDAVSPPVTDVQMVVGTSSAAGARASYDVSFTTSSTGGMSGAQESIVWVSLPAGTTVNSDTGIYSGSAYEGNCSPSGSVASCTVEGTVGPDTTLTMDLPVTNPPAGTYRTVVSARSDDYPATKPASSERYAITAGDKKVTGAQVAVETSSAAGARASYAVSFTTSRTGGLSGAAQSIVWVSLPAGTTVNSDTGIYSGSTYEGNCSPSGSVASCTIEGTVGPDTTLTADLPVINPSQGRYHASVSTSSDTQPVSSKGYAITAGGKKVDDVQVVVGTSSAAGAAASYTVSFTTSRTGGLSGAAQSIVWVSLPTGTTVTYYTGIYSGSAYEGECSPSGSDASCTIEGTVGPGTTLTMDLPVTNPPRGRYHATVSTSSDTQPANSNTYTIGA
jgi:PQQ-like domain